MVFKRELVKQIKQAYYNFLKSKEAVEIYRSAVVVSEENHRVNQSLFDNGKANRTDVLRSQNELSRISSLLKSAEYQSENAKSYFNFLLNRDLEQEILVESFEMEVASQETPSTSPSSREELIQVETAQEISSELIKLSNSYLIPQLSAFADVGSQAFDFEFDEQSRYYFIGLSLQWNLFSSGQKRLKTEQSKLDNQIAEDRNEQVYKSLQLQVIQAFNSLNASIEEFNGAEQRMISAKQLYHDTRSLYLEGQSLFIELMDAQNSMINAELQRNIAFYDFLSNCAEVERATGSFPLNK